MSARIDLASVYSEAGDLERAMPLHQQNFDDTGLVLGEHHSYTQIARKNYAVAMAAAQGRRRRWWRRG